MPMLVMVFVIAMIVVVITVTDLELVRAGGKVVSAGPLEWIFRLEELRIEIDGAVEVEAADVQHAVEREVAVLRAMELRDGVDALDALLERVEFGGAHEVGFVEQDHVGET